MPLSPLDLDAYFARTGYSGPRAPDLATLSGIVLAHIRTIPFENLDVLLGRPIRLDPEALLQKLVHEHRGGYCFEQNGLLLEVLLALGFDATPISARVRLGRPRDYTPARSHVFVRVEIDGVSWLADVGVGGLSPTAPLRLYTSERQETPHEPRRIVPELLTGGRTLVYHQAWLGGEWQDVCEFTLEPMPLIDREVANWYTSAHPSSHFRNRLIAARAGPDGERVTILNRELTIRGRDGVGAVTPIASPAHLLELLDAHFALRFPPETRFACEGLGWPAA